MAQAQCSCGKITVSVDAEPDAVVLCHCLDCQRRTGSPFGLGAYFAETDVKITGQGKEYVRDTESGGKASTYFCQECGSTVYWRLDRQRGRIGVAVGAFADPQFAPPQRSVWEQSKHHWVDVTAARDHFSKGRQ